MKHAITLAAGLSVVQMLSGCTPDAADAGKTQTAKQAIVGGDPATAGMFPGIVSLRGPGGHSCGGTLIAPNWVLTAGHCMHTGFRGDVAEVVAGSLVLSSQTGEHLPVWRAYRHAEYRSVDRPYEVDHDYALLRLKSNASEPSVRLASESEMLALLPKTELKVAGWGDTQANANMGSDQLLYTKVPLVERGECAKSYKNLPDETLCAGLLNGGKDSCQGDSGGPLFAMIGGKQTQVGIVSSGKDCALPAWYGLYAGVASASKWIATTMAQGETDLAKLGECVATCDNNSQCTEGEGAEACQLRNNTCLCACAGETTGLCDLSVAEAGDAGSIEPEGSNADAGTTADLDTIPNPGMSGDAGLIEQDGPTGEDNGDVDAGTTEDNDGPTAGDDGTTADNGPSSGDDGTTAGNGTTADNGTNGGDGSETGDGATAVDGTTTGDSTTSGDSTSSDDD